MKSNVIKICLAVLMSLNSLTFVYANESQETNIEDHNEEELVLEEVIENEEEPLTNNIEEEVIVEEVEEVVEVPEYEVIDTIESYAINNDYVNELSSQDLEYSFDIDVCNEVTLADGTKTSLYRESYLDWEDDFRNAIKNRESTLKIYFKEYNTAGSLSSSYLNALSADLLERVFKHTGVGDEGDYLRWHYGGYRSSLSGRRYSDRYELILSYTFTYHTTLAEEQQVTNEINRLFNEWNINDMTDYMKIKTIYDFICTQVNYDYAHSNDSTYTYKYTAYGALIKKAAVCQGYANLFYRMANDAGIDNRFIPGYASVGTHAWNIALLNGIYYNVDTTWDATYKQAGFEYEYFLVSDDNFDDHYRKEGYDTADFYNNYKISNSNYNAALDKCAAGHTIVLDSAVNATYYNGGLTAGKHCEVCHCILEKQAATPILKTSFTKGDSNKDNDVDFIDAIQTLKFNAGLVNLTAEQQFLSDMNNDKVVNFSDAIDILRQDVNN